MPQSTRSSIDETLTSASDRQLALLHHPDRRLGNNFYKNTIHDICFQDSGYARRSHPQIIIKPALIALAIASRVAPGIGLDVT